MILFLTSFSGSELIVSPLLSSTAEGNIYNRPLWTSLGVRSDLRTRPLGFLACLGQGVAVPHSWAFWVMGRGQRSTHVRMRFQRRSLTRRYQKYQEVCVEIFCILLGTSQRSSRTTRTSLSMVFGDSFLRGPGSAGRPQTAQTRPKRTPPTKLIRRKRIRNVFCLCVCVCQPLSPRGIQHPPLSVFLGMTCKCCEALKHLF